MEALIVIDASSQKIQHGQHKLLRKALLSLKSTGEDTGSAAATDGDNTPATGTRDGADGNIVGNGTHADGIIAGNGTHADGIHADGIQQQPRDDLYACLMADHNAVNAVGAGQTELAQNSADAARRSGRLISRTFWNNARFVAGPSNPFAVFSQL